MKLAAYVVANCCSFIGGLAIGWTLAQMILEFHIVINYG